MRIIICSILLFVITFSLKSQDITVDVALKDGKDVVPMPVIDRKKENNMTFLLSNGQRYSTVNGGESWEESAIEMPSSDALSWIFSNKKGELFRFDRGNGTGMQTFVSSDQGQSWKSLGDLQMPDISGLPSLFFDPEKDRVALTYIRDSDCQLDLAFVQSSNGKKWEDPVYLNSEKLDCNEVSVTNPDIVIDPREFMIAAWAQDEVIYLDRSYDDGKTWLRSDIAVQKRIGNRGKPLLTVDRSPSILMGAIYLVWIDSMEDGSVLQCIRTTNNGDIWSRPVSVHSDSADIYMPKVYMDQSNGYLYISYYVNAGDNGYDLYLAYSDDGAQTFEPVKINTEPLSFPNESAMRTGMNLDVFRQQILVAWSDFSTEQQTVYFRQTTFDDIKK
jgi:hypothetical protein